MKVPATRAFQRLMIIATLLTPGLLAQAQTTYTLTDLGNYYGSRLNNNGNFCGNQRLSSGVSNAFRYVDGVFELLGLPKGGTNPIPYSINGMKQTVGSFNNATGYMRGALWQPGSSKPIEFAPIDRGYNAAARGINARGDVAGWSTVRTTGTGQSSRAVLWRASASNGSSFTPIQLRPGVEDSAQAINDYGQILLRGGLWQPSVPNGTTGTYLPLDLGPNALGQGGHVCGTQNGVAALWTPDSPNGTTGRTVTLGTLGGYYSTAGGVNRSGEVVGSSTLTPADQSWDQGAGFLYRGGVLLNLNDFSYLASNGQQPITGWRIYEAVDINDAGQILASAFDPSGVKHAVLLTPQ